jgi:hypothetical protein
VIPSKNSVAKNSDTFLVSNRKFKKYSNSRKGSNSRKLSHRSSNVDSHFCATLYESTKVALLMLLCNEMFSAFLW